MYTPTILQPFYQKNKKIKKSLTQIQTQTQSQTQTQIHIHSYSSTLSSLAVGSKIFIIGRNAMVRYDTWSNIVVARSFMLFLRKKFSTAVISDKIYVAGSGSRTDPMEEYDPDRHVVRRGELWWRCEWRSRLPWSLRHLRLWGLLVGIVVGVNEIVRFKIFFFIHLKFSQETNKGYLYN